MTNSEKIREWCTEQDNTAWILRDGKLATAIIQRMTTAIVCNIAQNVRNDVDNCENCKVLEDVVRLINGGGGT